MTPHIDSQILTGTTPEGEFLTLVALADGALAITKNDELLPIRLDGDQVETSVETFRAMTRSAEALPRL